MLNKESGYNNNNNNNNNNNLLIKRFFITTRAAPYKSANIFVLYFFDFFFLFLLIVNLYDNIYMVYLKAFFIRLSKLLNKCVFNPFLNKSDFSSSLRETGSEFQIRVP